MTSGEGLSEGYRASFWGLLDDSGHGYLPDISIDGTDEGDWSRFYDLLLGSGGFQLDADRAVVPPPPTVDGFIAGGDEESPVVFLRKGEMEFRVWGWDYPRSISIDFNIYDVRKDVDAEAVLDLMAELGRLTHREVIMYSEGGHPNHACIRWSPGMDAPEILWAADPAPRSLPRPPWESGGW